MDDRYRWRSLQMGAEHRLGIPQVKITINQSNAANKHDFFFLFLNLVGVVDLLNFVSPKWTKQEPTSEIAEFDQKTRL